MTEQTNPKPVVRMKEPIVIGSNVPTPTQTVAPQALFSALQKNGIDFFTGVPDSLLKDLCAYITDNVSADKHVITANEGASVALAVGHYLATGNPGLVYMQNSGQGNTVNPLISLADPDVYNTPLLLVIGWRGQPGLKDEPQHIKQGKITLGLLETMGIAYDILPDDETRMTQSIEKAMNHMKTHKAPYALVVRKGLFEPYKLQTKVETDFDLNREGAVKLVTKLLGDDDIVVSTTGKTSRELFEFREELEQDHSRDFLTVGSMGHSSSIAMGIAMQKPHRQVFCFDGDGAVIMHMGSLAIIGQQGLSNFKHIIFNNGAHDSVGGQPTVGFDIDFTQIAKACGYQKVWRVQTATDITAAMQELKSCEGPAMLEILVNKGARKDLGRPTTTPIQNKEAFMGFVQK